MVIRTILVGILREMLPSPRENNPHLPRYRLILSEVIESVRSFSSKEADHFAMGTCPQTRSKLVASFRDQSMVALLEHSMIPMLLSSTW